MVPAQGGVQGSTSATSCLAARAVCPLAQQDGRQRLTVLERLRVAGPQITAPDGDDLPEFLRRLGVPALLEADVGQLPARREDAEPLAVGRVRQGRHDGTEQDLRVRVPVQPVQGLRVVEPGVDGFAMAGAEDPLQREGRGPQQLPLGRPPGRGEQAAEGPARDERHG